MRANELLQILQKNQDKELIVKIGDGLFCPVEDVKIFENNVIIFGNDINASVENSDFGPLKYEPNVKTVYIIDNRK